MAIGGVVIQFFADARQANREISKLTRKLTILDGTATTTGKGSGGLLGKAGAARMAGGAAAIAAAVGVIGAKSVKVAADFETSQNVLQANLGATGAEMKKLSDLAKKMGATTIFSAQDASDAMLELAKAGLSTAQIMGGGVQSAMALAATEGLALSDAATATSNAMNMFGLKAGDLPSVADAFAGAAKSSTASVSSLMEALAQVGPGARNAGMTLQDTVAVLAAFDNMGLKGSDAGTSLKTMLNRLVPQTKKARDAFANYGLAVYDASKAQKNLTGFIKPKSWSEDDVSTALADMARAQGLKGAQVGKYVDDTLWSEAFQNQLTNADGSFKSAAQWAGVLQSTLGKLGQVDLTEATNLLFGSDAGRAGSIFARLGTEGLQPFLDGAKQAGTAAEMADARTKGFQGATEALKGSLETLGITIGTNLLPKLTEFVNFINESIMPALQRFAEGGGAFDSFGRGLALLAQWMTTWAAFVVGWFRGILTVLYVFGRGVLAILSSLPIIGAKFKESEDRLISQFGAANTWLDGVETNLAEARTAVDEYVAALDAARALPAKPTVFTYYDPVTGKYSKSKPSADRGGADRAGGAGGTVNVTINNPKTEKAEDSAALGIRIARRTGGLQ